MDNRNEERQFSNRKPFKVGGERNENTRSDIKNLAERKLIFQEQVTFVLLQSFLV